MQLKNFDIIETLYESAKTIIYKAIRTSDSRPVIIKSRKNPEDEYLLKHEYEILRQNRIEGIANVLNLVYGGDFTYLILEDKQGIVLDSYIKNKTLTQREFVTISKNAAASLATIHAQGIIHRDIKPANMLIDKTNLNIWYIDFGVSVIAGDEFTSSEGLVGTIEYISPEQTGRVDLPVDFRSDLYSLGITLYYLLTKKMPFDMRSSMPLIHAQIAVMPPAPSDILNVSPVLSDIIMKLIQKSPDDRYRSAYSLEYDMALCLNQLNRDHQLKKFPLCTADSFTNLIPEGFLMGKEQQLRQLKNVFSRIPGRRSEVVIINGPPYSGKSGLVREFEDYAGKQGAITCRAVCDYKRKAEPYYAINRAFRQYYNQLVNQGTDLSGLKRALVYNLGENTSALVKMLPFISELLDDNNDAGAATKADSAPLSYTEEKRRDHYVFSTFLQIITSAAQPLVMLIDNVQSADRQSLQLLTSALKDENMQNFMLVVLLRSEEAEMNPLLSETLMDFEKIGTKVNHITLEYLTLDEVKSYLDDLFGDNSQGTDEMAEYILSVTGGRPYEVANLINMLAQKKLLRYSGETQSFFWDLDEIRKMDFKLDAESKFKDLYDSLQPAAREYLNYISVYGNNYSDTSSDSAALKFKMKPLIDARIIIENADNTYTFRDGLFRIYVINRIHPDERKQLHYEIGKNLLAVHKGTKEWDRQCEGITIHLNLAEELIESKEEKLLLAELNYETGNICLNSSNATMATVYFKKGLYGSGLNLFEENYKLALDMSINCALACLAKDNKEDFKNVSTRLLNNLRDEDDKHRYYSLIIKQCISQGNYRDAIAHGEKYLTGKGYLYEEQSNPVLSQKNYELKFAKELESRPITDFLHYKYSEDREVLRTGNIIALISDAMWQTRDDRTSYYHFLTICYAYENGIFDNLETIFYNGALRMIRKMDYKAAEYLIDICIKHCERFKCPKSRAYIRLGTQISHWLYPIERTFDIYKEARNLAIKEGLKLETIVADLMVLDARVFMTCDPREIIKELDLSIQNASISGSEINMHILTGVMRPFIKCITGRTTAPNSFHDAHFQEDIFIESNANEPLVMYYYHTYKLIALVINGYYEQAMTHQKNLEQMPDIQSGSILSLLNRFFHTIMLVRMSVVSPASLYIAAAKINQQLLKTWSELNPDNFLDWYLVAELCVTCTGVDTEKVMRIYTQALPIVLKKKNRLLEALMNEAMSEYWGKNNNEDYAVYHTFKAYEQYKYLGYFAKTRSLEPEMVKFGGMQLSIAGISGHSTGHSTGGKLFTNKTLDLETVFAIVSALNKDLDISRMSEKLLDCLIQNSGATRGFVVVLRDGKPYVEAVFYSAAQAGNISTSLLPMQLSKVDELTFPLRAVEYVLSRNTALSINYSMEKHLLFNDIYFKINNPESFMCMPIMMKDKSIGVVYLENSALAGVFSPERVNMVAFIINQTAAIFQNAMYYHELNNYAKTVELRLKEHSNLLNSMIAGIAHEINTPIGVCVTVISHMGTLTKNTISKFNEAKLSKADLKNYFDEIEKGAHIADANITRAVGLVQNFKKVSANQSNEVFEELNLLDTLNNIVEYIRPAIKKKISDIDIIGPESLTVVSCAGTLTQIFTNLIMNSVVHGFENKPKEQSRIKISFGYDKSNVTISYSDNGKGMSEDEVNKMFQPFFTTKRELGGSGLGAHIIYTHVTQTLNGQILCKSEPDKGAEFIMKFPLKQKQ